MEEKQLLEDTKEKTEKRKGDENNVKAGKNKRGK